MHREASKAYISKDTERGWDRDLEKVSNHDP